MGPMSLATAFAPHHSKRAMNLENLVHFFLEQRESGALDRSARVPLITCASQPSQPPIAQGNCVDELRD